MKERYGVVSLILVCVSVLVGGVLLYRARAPQWGVVDMVAVMRAVSEDLAKAYPNCNVPPRDMEKAVENVKACLQQVAREKGLMLLSKGAVLGGAAADYTPAVLQALEATP